MEYPGSKKWFDNKTKEREKNPELFRASIGFDFIFYKDKEGVKRIKCLELNGENTGIFGVDAIEKGKLDKLHRILARIRTQYHPKVLRFNQIIREMRENQKFEWYPYDKQHHPRVYDYTLNAKRNIKTIQYSYKAPPVLEMMFKDKTFLPDIIPAEYRIRQLSIQELSAKPFEFPKDISGVDNWILKPANGSLGEGVKLVPSSQFLRVMNSSRNFAETFINGIYVAQEYVKSNGADNSNGEKMQSMRLLWDVRVFEDGKFEIDFESGYQRVSNNYVVNKAQGAKSVSLSEAELAIGREAAEAILRRVVEVYRTEMQKPKGSDIIQK